MLLRALGKKGNRAYFNPKQNRLFAVYDHIVQNSFLESKLTSKTKEYQVKLLCFGCGQFAHQHAGFCKTAKCLFLIVFQLLTYSR